MAREKLGLDQNIQYLGYLGNIYQSDATLLCDSMNKLSNAATLIMIGSHKADMDERLKKSGRLQETGHVSFADMLTYLSACDVLVLPLTDSVANRGRWPSKINDYLAVGRPVVSCAVGDLVDLFGQSDIGRTTPGESTEFAAAIDALLDDPQASEELGRNARQLAEENLSTNVVAERLETFYRQRLAVG